MGLKSQSDKFAPIITPQAILSNALIPGVGVKSDVARSLSRLRMGRDRNDGDLVSPGAINPEDAPSGRGFVFRVGFEDFLAVRSFDRSELVGVESRVAWIGFQQSKGLSHCLELFGEGWSRR